MMQRLLEALRRNPYPAYSVMRRAAPVFHDRRHDLWVLFGYDSVRRALEDAEVFSSRAAGSGNKPLDWMIFMDPPQHTKLRALVMRTFVPKAIAALEPRIRTLCDALLEPGLRRGAMDVTTELADALPVLVIAEMLGVPARDREQLRGWADAILGLADTIWGGEIAARAIATYRVAEAQIDPYVSALLEERRSRPEDDLLTRLVQSEVDGERLAERDIQGFFKLLLLAGSETTTNLISNAVLCFLEHPDELARVRADLSLVPAAIEEVLRYRTPIQIVFRTTTRDVELEGRTIPQGKLVLLMVGSANRDPRQFSKPARFDVGRGQVRHVAFGHGIHFCIGAALARLEARVALTRLLERARDLRWDGSRRWPPRTAVTILGPRSLPVRC